MSLIDDLINDPVPKDEKTGRLMCKCGSTKWKRYGQGYTRPLEGFYEEETTVKVYRMRCRKCGITGTFVEPA